MGLQVIDGKLSKYYDIFSDYELERCEVTNTRLMGVVALRITWRGRENPESEFYQLIHLDYSEYGIDDYYEYECIPGNFKYHEQKAHMKFRWEILTGGLGGKIIEIEPEILAGLVKSGIIIANGNIEREYDDENREFRIYAVRKLEMMLDSLKKDNKIKNDISSEEIIRKTSLQELTTCETINYFLMRLVDCDFEAAAYLSTEELASNDMIQLRKNALVNQGLQTLMRNQIKLSSDADDYTDEKTYPYRCNMTTLGQAGYYYSSLVVCLDRDYHNRDARVSEIRVGSINKISTYEAAMQLSRREYITVFDCRDRILDGFDGGKIHCLLGIEPKLMNNGWLYTIYNKDNSHVNSADYRMDADVYGYALLSIDGEFILMSNKLDNITYMDECTQLSAYAQYMTLDGRYQLESPIFNTLCQQRGVMFHDLIEHGEPPR